MVSHPWNSLPICIQMISCLHVYGHCLYAVKERTINHMNALTVIPSQGSCRCNNCKNVKYYGKLASFSGMS